VPRYGMFNIIAGVLYLFYSILSR